MNKLKTAEEYINNVHKYGSPNQDFHYCDYSKTLELIKQIQKDTIDYVVKECAENAYCDLIHPPDDEYPELEESEYMVVKSSILSVADKLKKEIDGIS